MYESPINHAETLLKHQRRVSKAKEMNENHRI
jgi:hypothetical protein